MTSYIQPIARMVEPRYLLSLLAVSVLTACPVDSTAVNDANLIAKFLVQNDNGRINAMVNLGTSDHAGYHKVDLEAGESIYYHSSTHSSTHSSQLRKQADGEYIATLPTDAHGPGSFTVVRRSEDRQPDDREITNNQVFLPDTFQALLAEPVQTGAVIDINWSAANTPQFLGSTMLVSEESFNAIGACQNGGELFDVAITDGQLTEQNDLAVLEIPVTEHLTQVLELSTDRVVATTCEFDVQLVRNVTGITNVALSNKSSASGQVLKNVAIQWSAS